MPRMMSFALTTPQFRARTKTVTRRLRWKDLPPGTILMGVEQAMGLGKGGKVVRLGLIEVVNTRWEPLNTITPEDVVLEGFPDWTPGQFITMLCKANTCAPDTLIHRIQFRYLD